MTKTVERKPLDAPIRIWYQLVASENRMSNSIAATGRVCARAAAKGTQVEVRGTRHGALGDQFRFFWHYDVREIIDNGLSERHEPAGRKVQHRHDDFAREMCA